MNAPETAPAAAPEAPRPARLASLDAYRGFVMLLMASAGFGLAEVAKNFKQSGFWTFVGYHTSHAEWAGCAFWDLIQPSFMFMVGVAMPFSYAARKARRESPARQAGHAAYRAAVLILLGILLVSNWKKQTEFSFFTVLQQIGLAYFPVFLLLGRGPRVHALAAGAVLAGYWLLFALHPLPGPGFDWKAAEVPDAWPRMTGFFAHWEKNANAAAAFDRWFLNLFPRPEPFACQGGGYTTLNFVPSIATLLFGVMAGEILLGPRTPMEKFCRLAAAGAAGLVAGQVLGWTLCPVVKRIWSPSWAVYSAGWAFLMLAGFYWLIDIRGLRRWAFPFVVVGMNSIAMYVMAQLIKGWVRDTLKIHLGASAFAGTFGPVVSSAAILLVLWLICLWMYRRKVFLRI